MLTEQLLDSYVGVGIERICPNGFDDKADNHCAHFVSHALGLDFGMTCRTLRPNSSGAGANVRVHEIFARCAQRQEILQCSGALSGLIFVSGAKNFVTRGGVTTLQNVPKKHIGILLNGYVWHYSNTQDKVVKQPMSTFLNHYPGQTNALWLGSLPSGAVAVQFAGAAASSGAGEDQQLSANFRLSEFHCKDGTPVPGELLANVQELAKNLQVLRDSLKKPITVNSGYRTESYNKKVGGSSNSQHVVGKAADIAVSQTSPTAVKAEIEKLIAAGRMKQGGIGLYGTFVHYDVRGTKARW